MKRAISISGGKSSAYIAANYPFDYLLFALVTIEDVRCTPKDKKLVQIVSDKIGREFIATAEDDVILHTMLDLEQYLGHEIVWVVGETFDYVVDHDGGWLPNILHRYCTTEMKLRPLFRYWREHIGEPVEMAIGFRAGEERRANRMLEKANSEGLMEFKDVVGMHPNGKRKWATVGWQKPVFPMIEDGIRRDRVVEFWKDKPVRFAERNNCVGCFHRNPILLNLMFQKFPEKMEWFSDQEKKEGKGTWRSDVSYEQVKRHKTQVSLLDLDGFTDCDSGYCGL